MNTRAFRKIFSLLTAFVLALNLACFVQAADTALTRAELAKLVVCEMGLEDEAKAYADKTSFTDVAKGSDYAGYINLAAAKGIFNGVAEGKFAPDNKASQLEAATAVMRMIGVEPSLLKTWPASYQEFAEWSGLTKDTTFSPSSAANAAGVAAMFDNASEVAKRPVIGISWKSPTQDYTAFKTVIREAGGIPVEVEKVTSSVVGYGADGKIEAAYLEETGNLKQVYADQIKARLYGKSNVAAAMKGIDGMFFTGGEDVSPSLFKVPQKEANEGEEINSTRDISDYTLMAWCQDMDIPTFGVCRGEQVLSIVAGCDFIQDIPNYYKAQNATYGDTHRMPVGAPNRTYARHDVTVSEDSQWLYDIIGSTSLKNVSSWHHQAVSSVEGTDLKVVATTEANGVKIVEGVELQGKTYCLGVQFHPENDCKLTLFDKTPEKSLCDYDTCMNFFRTLVDYASRPVIGISWKSPTQDYSAFKQIIREAGGRPVELAKVTSSAVSYGADGKVEAAYLESTGNLKQVYADQIKARLYDKSNVEAAMEGIDGVFFTGGEDVSPSLFKVPQKEANEGEEINSTRDISDYTLMAWCQDKDVPTFGVCRGEQVLAIVAGADFIQDIPNYYKAQNATYGDTHRMPVGAPNRTYARHDVTISKDSKWLYNIVGSTSLANVSSWHHQAVGSVAGTGLKVVATAEANGVQIVEGVELQGNKFCLGVQFHPENDCKLTLVEKTPEKSLCDYDTCLRFLQTLVAYAADRPVIGISWKSPTQNYEAFKAVIREAGGIPVELPQVTSKVVGYDAEGKVESKYLESTGNLKQGYADQIKARLYDKSNVEAVMDDIDGVFFTGGEDVSPSLFKVPQKEANEGEEINSTRDISDYTLMAWCQDKDVPTFGVCRGEQVLAIVAGCEFIQDIPNYYKAQNATYADTHRMPVGAPNRTYARHDVTVSKDSQWLYDIIGSTSLKNVSSWHHQAVGSVEGTKLKVVASTEANGVKIIEGVELQGNTYCLGVQFHPENDCKLTLFDKTPEKSLCDYETCMNFFRTLVEYAGK